MSSQSCDKALHGQRHGLEPGMSELSIDERILASVQRIVDSGVNPSGNGRQCFQHQETTFHNFFEYLLDMATGPDDFSTPFCRIILPPRTGKTVIAGKLIQMTGLCATFVVPKKVLIRQVHKELELELPKPPILPIDLLLPPGEDYSCGELLQTAPGVDQIRRKVHLTPKNPVRSVRLQSRILASPHLSNPCLTLPTRSRSGRY